MVIGYPEAEPITESIWQCGQTAYVLALFRPHHVFICSGGKMARQ